MNFRRPLIVAFVAASSLLTLAVPAGAATPKATWTHQVLACAKGHKPGSQSDCNGLDVPPRHKGRLDEPISGTVNSKPSCNPNDTLTIWRKDFKPDHVAPTCPGA